MSHIDWTNEVQHWPEYRLVPLADCEAPNGGAEVEAQAALRIRASQSMRCGFTSWRTHRALRNTGLARVKRVVIELLSRAVFYSTAIVAVAVSFCIRAVTSRPAS
ncbi:hypothetical protein B0H10DRAFT_2212838 [Mycena sp. CBHHK59/15]|nr:hypothetical protein B0H10DRAFT_2212838 [Mycena sp. CBHHK59/15]